MKLNLKRAFLALLLLMLTAIVGAPSCVEAAPVNYVVPVGSSYRDYAVGKSTKSLDETALVMANNGHNMVATYSGTTESDAVLAARRKREIAGGYLTMDAGYGDTSLRVPLGWAFASTYRVGGAQSEEDQDFALLPGKNVIIAARSDQLTPAMQTSRNGFEMLKKTALSQTRSRLKAQGFVTGPLELLDLPGEAFAVRALKVTKAGVTFSYLEIHKSRSTPTQRADYAIARKNPNSIEASSGPQQPLVLSLLAPTAVYPKYLGLLGLMLRDAGINAVRTEFLTLEQFQARSARSQQFIQLANQTLAQLKAGQVEDYVAQVMPATIEMAAQFAPDEVHKLTPKDIEAVKQKIAADARQKLVPALRKADKVPSKLIIMLISNNDPVDPIFNVIWNRYPAKVGDALYQIRMKLIKGKPALEPIFILPN